MDVDFGGMTWGQKSKPNVVVTLGLQALPHPGPGIPRWVASPQCVVAGADTAVDDEDQTHIGSRRRQW